MSIKIILLFTIIQSFFICDACEAKVPTTMTDSSKFTKLNPAATETCQHIGNNFNKLNGFWFSVVRTVTSKNLPRIRCGRLTIFETSETGFKSRLIFLNHKGDMEGVSLTGSFVNETVVEIAELDRIVTGNPEWKYPSTVELGICDNDSIFFFQSIHYFGGSMVFARDVIEFPIRFQKRFATYDEERGNETTVQVSFDCRWKHNNYK